MKRLVTIILVLCAIQVSKIAYSQNRAWMNPDSYNNIRNTGLTITNVKFYSNATVVEFLYDNSYSHSFRRVVFRIPLLNTISLQETKNLISPAYFLLFLTARIL